MGLTRRSTGSNSAIGNVVRRSGGVNTKINRIIRRSGGVNTTVYSAAAAQITISGTITDNVNGATIATPLTYSVTGAAGSQVSFQKTITANTGYTHGTYTENSTIWSISRSGNTLTFSYTIPETQTDNITNNFTVNGNANIISYNVSGTVTASLTACTVSVDGDTTAPYVFSETRTVNSGGSFNIIFTATSGNQFFAASDASIIGSLPSGFTQGTNVLSANGSTITMPINYPAGASNFTNANFSIGATATASDSIAFPTVNLVQAGTAQCITPTTNTGSGTVTFSSVASWLTIEAGNNENGCGSGTWRFSADPNNTYTALSDSVTVSKGNASSSFTVNQAALAETITLETPGSIDGPANSTATVSYTEGGPSTVTCSVSDTTNYSCSVNNITNVVTVTALTANNTSGDRQVTLTVNKGSASDSVVFTQASNIVCSFNSVTINGATSANLLANVNLSVVNTNNGNCGTVTYSWTIVSGSGIFVSGQTGSSVTIRGTSAGTLRVQVTATGTGNVTGTDTHDITISGGGFPP